MRQGASGCVTGCVRVRQGGNTLEIDLSCDDATIATDIPGYLSNYVFPSLCEKSVATVAVAFYPNVRFGAVYRVTQCANPGTLAHCGDTGADLAHCGENPEDMEWPPEVVDHSECAKIPSDFPECANPETLAHSGDTGADLAHCGENPRPNASRELAIQNGSHGPV